jgi:hypothetical protein
MRLPASLLSTNASAFFISFDECVCLLHFFRQMRMPSSFLSQIFLLSFFLFLLPTDEKCAAWQNAGKSALKGGLYKGLLFFYYVFREGA